MRTHNEYQRSLYFFVVSLSLIIFDEAAAAVAVSGCSVPETPHNGNYEVSGCAGILADPFDPPCWKDAASKFPVGRSISYFCLAGYTLRGEKSLTCLDSGTWSGPFPKCCKRRKGSGSAKEPAQAERGIPGSTLNVYEHAEEKRMDLKEKEISDDTVSCPPLEVTKSVEFECRSPNGKVGSCDQPPLPPYTVAHLKCAKYFKSSGDLAYRYRKCKPDGTWSTEGSISCITDCGKSEFAKKPLITKGETSDKGQWPWHVAIYNSDGGRKNEYICGGSLISPYTVLTAAHCVTKAGTSELRELSSLTLALGKFNRKLNAPESNPIQIRTPKHIFIPDGYSPLSFDADIALIVLSAPIQFSFYVRPVCIPENFNSLIEEYQVQEGNLGTVVGWGLTEDGKASDTLKMAQLPVISSRICIDSFQSFFQQNKRYTNFCAGYRNGTGVCNGDSGGGMVFPSGQGNDLRWYLQGVVSVGVPDPADGKRCNSNQYSLFTRVGRFADWIVRTLTPDGYL